MLELWFDFSCPYAYLASRRAPKLGVPIENIEVVHGDTATTPFGMGSYGSRSLAVGGWPAPVGIVLVADKLATLMLVVSAAVTLCVLVYSIGQGMADGNEETPLYPEASVAGRRTARGPLTPIRVPDTNHYTILGGAAGVRAVAYQLRRFAAEAADAADGAR